MRLQVIINRYFQEAEKPVCIAIETSSVLPNLKQNIEKCNFCQIGMFFDVARGGSCNLGV